jgi:hypothetical protein
MFRPLFKEIASTAFLAQFPKRPVKACREQSLSDMVWHVMANKWFCQSMDFIAIFLQLFVHPETAFRGIIVLTALCGIHHECSLWNHSRDLKRKT